MPGLSASSSVFQLAVGVNAVLPVLIHDFEEVRKDAAESLLRKIKEYCPDFVLKEKDRVDFVDFTFQSTAGLRHAKLITFATAVISLALCGVSLVALCCSAIKPNGEVSNRLFFAFVGVTLVGAPLFYIARNYYLKLLYSILVTYSTNDEADALLFARCVNIYLTFKKGFERNKYEKTEIQLLSRELMLAQIRLRLYTVWFWVRSTFSPKRRS